MNTYEFRSPTGEILAHGSGTLEHCKTAIAKIASEKNLHGYNESQWYPHTSGIFRPFQFGFNGYIYN